MPAGTPPSLSVSVTPARSRLLADYVALTKPRVNFLVVLTTFAAFWLGAEPHATLGLLVHTLLGTLLVASGAAVLNQVLERDVDARMLRTQHRPIPDGRLAAADAAYFGLALSVVGVIELAVGTNALAAVVACFTLASYALIYTPLKRVTSLSTVIGAVPGALPPVIGWAAARGELSIEAAILFAIVFLWQMPHVLAVSWMYRDDYARGGIRVLPVTEPDGSSTARQTVSYAAALIPVSLIPTLVGFAGALYFTGALIAGLLLLVVGANFARFRTVARARQLFLASLLYLPLLWTLLLADSI
jgi:protoheme IX farnesyltransferase